MKPKKLAKRNVIYLTEKRFKSIMDILEKQKKPNAALKKAFAALKEVVKEKEKP